MIEYKMNELTYEALLEVYGYLKDGRVILARDKLEEMLGVDTIETP